KAINIAEEPLGLEETVFFHFIARKRDRLGDFAKIRHAAHSSLYSFIQRPRPANQGLICYFDLVNSVLIRYHEIALKKGNRPYFIDLLKRNLVASLRDLKLREAKTLQARILLTFDNHADEEEIGKRLQRVFGIANFSFVDRQRADIDALRDGILDRLDGREFESFRIDARRADKSFPLTS